MAAVAVYRPPWLLHTFASLAKRWPSYLPIWVQSAPSIDLAVEDLPRAGPVKWLCDLELSQNECNQWDFTAFNDLTTLGDSAHPWQFLFEP